MTDQPTRDADRELDMALDTELRMALDTELREDDRVTARKSFIKSLDRSVPPLFESERREAIEKYDEEHRTWQSDHLEKSDPITMTESEVRIEAGIDDPVRRAKLDEALEKIQATIESSKAWDAAEERAKKRMKARQAFTVRLKQRVRAFMMAVWALVFFAVIGAGVWAYYNFKTIVPAWNKYTSAQKNCIFKVGERTVTGTRSISYRYYQVLNWRAHDESTVETETRLDVSSNGMTVIQYVNGVPEKLSISDGEKYKQLLKPADRYSFFMDNGKNYAELSFNDICR